MNTENYIPSNVAGAKRLADIVLASIGLCLLVIIFPIIALCIKLESKGPLFFHQLRIGQARAHYTSLFFMYKFRTMAVDAESKSGPVWAAKNDPRVTRVGSILRKTRLDELPQLYNVLIGDMSLIGPRPERPGFYQKLEHAIPYFAERTYGLKPGITGLAQVNQGYDRDLDDVRRKVAFDHAYALSLSGVWGWFTTDLSIAVRTITVMVLGRGQ